MPYIRNADGSFATRRLTVKDVLAQIAQKNIRFIDLQFADVPGRLQHVTIPAEMMNEYAFIEGVSKLDGS